MRRWIWRVLLAVAVMAALTVGASAVEVTVDGIQYDLDTGTVIGPVDKTITQANIQAVVNNTEITRINPSAFRLCKGLTSVTVPRTITTIGTLAFSGCDALKTVDLPDGLKEIPDGAFYDCTSLGSISIPSSVIKIGKNAFFASGVSSVTFPAEIAFIGEGAFENCGNLASVTFQDSVSGNELNASVTPITAIGPRAFNSCKKLSNLTLSGSVASIGDNAFEACDLLKKVVVPSGTSSIGKSAFSGCPLTDVVIFGKSVTFGTDAFSVTANTTIHSGKNIPDTALPAGTAPEKVHVFATSSLTVRPSISCTDSGSVRESFTCTVKDCKYKYNEPERVVPPLAHTLQTRTARKDPSCTTTGQLEQKGCVNCAYVEKPISIPALGHDPQDVDTTASENRIETQPASCTEPGILTIITKRCGRTGCDEPLDSTTESIPATGHKYDKNTKAPEPREVKNKKPTCTEEGLKVFDYVCDVCGTPRECPVCKEKEELEFTEEFKNHLNDKTQHPALETILAQGHTWDWDGTGERTYGYKVDPDDKPTCEHEGKLTAFKTCTVCDEREWDDTDTKTEDKLPHTPPDDWKEEILEPGDCETPKKTKYPAYECTVCGEEVPERIETGDIAGEHKWIDDPDRPEKIVTPATCETEGKMLTAGQKCSLCGKLKAQEEKVIPIQPHKWINPVEVEEDLDGNKVENTKATCGTDGVSHVIVTCENCNTKEYQVIKIPATGVHAWGDWKLSADGKTEIRSCTNPGCTVTDSRPVSPTDPDDPDKPTDPDKPDPPKPEDSIFKINLVQASNGTFTANKSTAKQGETVIVTYTADSGYVLDMIRVIGKTSLVSYTDLGGGRFQFTMPASDVEVRVTFDRADADYSGNWGTGFGNDDSSGGRSDPRRTTDIVPVQIEGHSVAKADAYEQLFQDVPTGHWAAGEINWASEMGYMSGSNGRFNPDGLITHQQMWMVLARLTGASPANMAEARSWAVRGGYADGSSPTGAVKRHQLVTALHRCASLTGGVSRTNGSLAGYVDSGAVPARAREAFSWALTTGVVNADANKKLNPAKNLTRAEFASILYCYSQRF